VHQTPGRKVNYLAKGCNCRRRRKKKKSATERERERERERACQEAMEWREEEKETFLQYTFLMTWPSFVYAFSHIIYTSRGGK
jgi:hypothetical protein